MSLQPILTGDVSRIYVERVSGGLRRLNRHPRYMPPHRVRGIRSSDGATEWEESESVGGHGIHRPVRGRVHIRLVPLTQTDELARIDAERAELRKRLAELDALERATLQSAWDSSEDLTLKQVKESSR